MVRLRNFLAHLRAQLWLLPAMMSAGAAALAYLAVSFGALVSSATGGSSWWLYSGDASTARGLLSAFLSGLLTMTSLVVSLTVVILTTAASQLGPRLITFFMADRHIQFVLGLFISTTLYIIVVLRTLNDTLGSDGVPHVAVTIASALTIACLFALLFYVHKIARSVIADNLVDAVWSALCSDIRQILLDEKAESAESVPDEICALSSVSLGRAGYVQLVDYAQLLRVAHARDITIRVRVRAGHFVLPSNAHVDVLGEVSINDELARDIQRAFVIGSSRTPAQDIEHGLRQMVEIGLRALSPGINDPMTALTVIDRLGAALLEIFARPLPPSVLKDDEGTTRVIADRSDHLGLVSVAFNQLRQAGETQPAILISIARTLGRLAASCSEVKAKDALRDQLMRVEQSAKKQAFIAADADDLHKAIADARVALEQSRTSHAV